MAGEQLRIGVGGTWERFGPGQPGHSIIVDANGLPYCRALTKTDVGLSNVDNTSDADKPVSTAMQTALNAKQSSIVYPGNTTQFLRADGNWSAPPGGPGGEAFPVGAVFIAVVSTDPATLLGYGTWVAFGAGRVLVGRDAGDPDFDTAEETGGAKTKPISAHAGSAVADHASHTHQYTQVPNHVHGFTDLRGATTGAATTTRGVTESQDTSSTVTGLKTANPDGGVATGTTAGPSATLSHSVTQPNAHSDLNVVQPYIVVYMWKRTA